VFVACAEDESDDVTAAEGGGTDVGCAGGCADAVNTGSEVS